MQEIGNKVLVLVWENATTQMVHTMKEDGKKIFLVEKEEKLMPKVPFIEVNS